MKKMNFTTMMSRLFKKIRSITMKKISDFLVVVFMALMIPSILVGSYRIMIETYAGIETKKENFPEEKVDDIQYIIDTLHENIGPEARVSVYLIDFVENKRSGEMEQFASVICNSGDPKGAGRIRYWNYEPAPRGYRHYNSKVKDEKEYYIPDIYEEKSVFFGDTKDDVLMTGIRSIYGVKICDGEFENQTFFLAVSFIVPNASEKYPLFRYRAKIASKEIRKIIDL